MALADGELPPAEAEAVETAAARDPALAARLAQFHRTARLVKAAVPPEDVPPALRRAVDAAIERAVGSPASAAVLPFPGSAARRSPWYALPAAAALLAVVFGVGGFLAGRQVADEPVVAAATPPGGLSPALADVLDQSPSGRDVTVDGRTVRLVQSFRTGAGDLCRELTVGGARTIACRRGDAWRTELTVASPPDAAGSYVPASGDDVTAAWLAAAAAGPALDPVAEAGALAER